MNTKLLSGIFWAGLLVTGTVFLGGCSSSNGASTNSTGVEDMSAVSKEVLPSFNTYSTSNSKLMPVRSATLEPNDRFSVHGEHNIQGTEIFNIFRSFSDPSMNACPEGADAAGQPNCSTDPTADNYCYGC